METIIKNHKKAAEHLEEAAKHHLEAAKHHEEKNLEKAHLSTIKITWSYNSCLRISKRDSETTCNCSVILIDKQLSIKNL